MTTADRIRRKYASRKPFFLTAMGYVSSFGAVFAVLVLALDLCGAAVRYTVNGRAVEPPLSFVVPVGLVVVFGAQAYAILREKTWARHLLIGYGLMGCASGILFRDVGAVFGGLVWTAFLVWYLFEKKNVKVYYQLLREKASRQRTRTGG